MSDPTAMRPTYDPNELRRCIALSFSPKDLRAIAEDLGATDLHGWDRGIQEAAREVVRHFEKLGNLDQLVAKLAEARPLMEWPAPSYVPAPVLQPTATNSPPPVPEAIVVPMAEVPKKPAEPASAASTESVPILRDPFAPALPGTLASSTAQGKQLDGRKLTMLFGIGFVVVTTVAIGLFLAVRVGKSPETTAPTELHAGRPLRPEGPARTAADAMKRAFESLARGCDLQIPPKTDVGPWLFAAAYEQCGSRARIPFAPTQIRENRPIPSDPSDDDDIAEPTPPVAVPRQPAAPRDGLPKLPTPPPAKTAPVDISSGCLDKCAASKSKCSRACGDEPTSGSAYDRWQSCQTQCVSASSKCRLACQ